MRIWTQTSNNNKQRRWEVHNRMAQKIGKIHHKDQNANRWETVRGFSLICSGSIQTHLTITLPHPLWDKYKDWRLFLWQFPFYTQITPSCIFIFSISTCRVLKADGGHFSRSTELMRSRPGPSDWMDFRHPYSEYSTLVTAKSQPTAVPPLI